MTMAEGMVRPDALSDRDGRLALAVHLPWYRSLPISCLEAVEVAPAIRSPSIQTAPGGALVQRATARTEGTLR